MKTITLIALTVVLFSCRKNIPNGQPESKFNCVCKTTTEYVDHCGKDSSIASLSVYGTDQENALRSCKGNEIRTEDSYSITTRHCELN